jgi:RNA polymerase sigma factor (sigma-70 family)
MVRTAVTDEALLTSGDAEDFGRFYDRHVELLLGYFQRRTRDPEAAADLTAETFAAALRGRSRFQPRETPASAWLFTIAQRRLADYQRRGHAEDRMRRRLGMERLAIGEADAVLIARLGEAEAYELTAQLPPDQRDAVRAHVIEEYDYGELARRSEVSEAVVRKRVSRGLQTLRDRLGGTR